MKLALLSDIHSNRQALDACMSHARAQGAERFAWLGDLVGYGADPGYVVRQAMALVAAGHCVIGGNHDALAVHPPKPGDRAASTVAAYGAQWTHEQLSAARARLSCCPPPGRRDRRRAAGTCQRRHPRALALCGQRNRSSAMPGRRNPAPRHLPCVLRPCAPANAVPARHLARARVLYTPAGRGPSGAATAAVGGDHRLGRPAARRRPACHVCPARHRCLVAAL
jgi:hypothetical protein